MSTTTKPAGANGGSRETDDLGRSELAGNSPTTSQKQYPVIGELADRVAAGELCFLDAVDVAYEAAVWSGLTETVGDDIVQATLAAAFANARAPA
jgi:hypothetical protein